MDTLPCERNGTADSSLSRATTSTASPLAKLAWQALLDLPGEHGMEQPSPIDGGQGFFQGRIAERG